MNLPLSTSKINLRIIFNDVTIREHELITRIKTFIKWISENDQEIAYLILYYAVMNDLYCYLLEEIQKDLEK